MAEPPLDRAALLLALVHAASAAATGGDDRDEQRTLESKPFELRMRFGCGGPATGKTIEGRGWSFDAVRHVLRVQVPPELGLETPAVKALAGADIEAVEGFRIMRPWALSADCPVASPSSAPVAQGDAVEPRPAAPPNIDTTAPFVGIAQFFEKSDPRTHRRDHRAYSLTTTLGADDLPGAKGFDIVLAGRLKPLAGGRVIACRIVDPELPPACIIAAEFDTVTMERADTGEQIAQWSSS